MRKKFDIQKKDYPKKEIYDKMRLARIYLLKRYGKDGSIYQESVTAGDARSKFLQVAEF